MRDMSGPKSNRCTFTMKYYDRIKNQEIQYKCPLTFEPNTAVCCFHDHGNHHIYHDVKTAKLQEIIENTEKTLECIGFELSQTELKYIFDRQNLFETVLFNYSIFVGELKLEMEEILIDVDFTKARFSKLDFSGVKFKGKIYFDSCTFDSFCNFSNTEFSSYARFNGAKFLNDNKHDFLVDFSNTDFADVDFDHAIFDREVKFAKTKFQSTSVSFHEATFKKITFSPSKIHHVKFSGATFDGITRINGTSSMLIFAGEASFENTIFNNETDISAIFHCDANFNKSTFNKKTNLYFICCGDAKFSDVSFIGEIDFGVSRFNNTVSFARSKFFQKIVFSYITFNDIVKFRDTTFLEKVEFENVTCSLMDFSNCTFNEVDFNDLTINSELYYDNESFYKTEYLKKNERNFAEYVIPRLKLKNIESGYELKIKYGNKGRVSNIEESEDVISVTKGDYGELLVFFKTLGYKETAFALFQDIPIKFDYAKFEKKARFIDMDLSNVSFKGVQLSNVEFHHPKWRQKNARLGKKFGARNIIVDEIAKQPDYQSIAYTYNQLRKNYESELRFSLASDFFIGEMEAIRKGFWKGSKWEKSKSIGYLIYYGLAKYGESILLPLLVWSPLFIFVFMGLRIFDDNSVTIHNVQRCDNIFGFNATSHCTTFSDSLSSYFQFPRSQNLIDIVERIVSAPILGTAFIALKRRFERTR